MFELEQIKAAHSKVKSGADFPSYIQDLKKLEVVYYETFVSDGNTNYYGKNDYKISSDAKYETLLVVENSDVHQFKLDLKAHQQGKTNYPTFCEDCAKNGVQKWVVCLEKMTCTYYNLQEKALLVEEIPSI